MHEYKSARLRGKAKMYCHNNAIESFGLLLEGDREVRPGDKRKIKRGSLIGCSL